MDSLKTRIHLLSDLHLEFESFTPSLVAETADIVVLAGDIDVKARAVSWAREMFNCPVVYVPGNHEYYGGHLETTLEKMREASCERVRVLDCDEWVLNGVRFLGATCWTNYTSTGNSPAAKWDAQHGLNDFKKIRAAGYRKAQPSDFAMRNRNSLRWLKEKLAEPFAGNTVVVSHHAPSLLSLVGKHKTNNKYVEQWKLEKTASSESHLDASYANDWDELMNDSIALWVHGHTHEATDYWIRNTRIISNPKGYPGELTGFDPDLIISI